MYSSMMRDETSLGVIFVRSAVERSDVNVMTLRQTPLQVLLLQCETEETLQRDNKAVAFTTEQSYSSPLLILWY